MVHDSNLDSKEEHIHMHHSENSENTFESIHGSGPLPEHNPIIHHENHNNHHEHLSLSGSDEHAHQRE